MRTLITALILVAIPLALSAPASATPPQHRQFINVQDLAYSCGLTENVVFNVSATDFYDASGNYTYTRSQVSFDGVITNPLTGETFRDSGHQTIIFPAQESEPITFTGIIYNIRTPAEGIIVQSTGRLIVTSDFATTLFNSAKDIPIEAQDAAVCTALA